MPFPLDLGLAGGAVLILLAARPLTRRAWRIARQRVHRALGAVEDPVQAMDLAYRRQVASLQEVRRGVATVVTAEKRLELQAQGLQQAALRLHRQAREALAGGREDFARLALTRAEGARSQMEQLTEQRRQLHQQAERLQTTVEQLRSRVEGVRSHRDTLRAQYSAARARVQIGESLAGLGAGTEDVRRLVERAGERTLVLQARAAAIDELLERGTLAAPGGVADPVERELQGLAASAAVDARLARLREELADPATIRLESGPLGPVHPTQPPTEDP